MTRKQQAEALLSGLWEELGRYGVPHIVGSYRMDLMAWNDLDIDIENQGMSLSRLHELTGFILCRFAPVWYEAKEEITAQGKRVWFHGFETFVEGELWNVDLWFFDQDTIREAERYCDGIAARTSVRPGAREEILRLKKELIAKGLYPNGGYTSMDVYEAVLNQRVAGAEDFLTRYQRN